MAFDYSSGNPDNLTGGLPARMIDIQGPFYDLRTWLNSAASGTPPPLSLSSQPVLDVGLANQVRAGRQLAVADFTALGLSTPVGLFNLSGLTNLGTGGALVNKGAVPFGVGINGLASSAAQFAGSTAQVLYIVDTGAADPFRIKTGSWGCWFRTAKRGTRQDLVAKFSGVAGQYGWFVNVTTGNVVSVQISLTGSDFPLVNGVSDVADDRWHFVVGQFDGTTIRLYVDGILEGTGSASGSMWGSTGPFNIGASGADAGTGSSTAHYGRIDEAFVTADVLSDDQVRALYCAKIPHTLAAVPTSVRLNVRRRRRGGPFVVGDFPTQPLRLYNLASGGATPDQGSNGVALTNSAAYIAAGADGTGEAHGYTASGSDTATDAALPAALTSRSYGCWLKTTLATGNNNVMAWGATPGTNDARLSINAGQVNANSGPDVMGSGFVADGQWHFVVVTEDNAAGDGVKRKVYTDGRLVGGSTVMTSLALGGANFFRIGANSAGAGAFTGQIDGAFVCGYALTFEQQAALYAKGSQALPPSPKNPGDHIEHMDTGAVYAVFDTLDSTAQVDLGVTA